MQLERKRRSLVFRSSRQINHRITGVRSIPRRRVLSGLLWQRIHTSSGLITLLTLGGGVTRSLRRVIIATQSCGPNELGRHFGAERPRGGFSENRNGESLSNGICKLVIKEFGHAYFARVWRMFLSDERFLIRSVRGFGLLSSKLQIWIGYC